MINLVSTACSWEGILVKLEMGSSSIPVIETSTLMSFLFWYENSIMGYPNVSVLSHIVLNFSKNANAAGYENSLSNPIFFIP